VTARAHDNPPPLVVAASLAAVEGGLVLLFGLVQLTDLRTDQVSSGVALAVFFTGYGAALVFCAWQLSRARPWARGPVLLAQLIQLGVAWSFWGGGTTWLSLSLGLVALVVLAGLLHPQSVDALAEGEPDRF
jgi:hypothetical protein